MWFSDLRARIDAEVAWDQPFYMVGETFDGNRDLIKSYVDPNTLLNGQFDFPLRGAGPEHDPAPRRLDERPVGLRSRPTTATTAPAP